MGRFDDLDDYNDLMGVIVAIETEQAEKLAEFFQELYHPQSVLDVGCGPGNYLAPYLRVGIEGLGIDACETAGTLIPHNFERVDLRYPWDPSHRYDLAMCIEVAEHLKPEFSATLVDTLVKSSDLIYFTAAFPGQGGSFHHCERPASYWLDLFAQHGYGLHPDNDILQYHIHSDPAYEYVQFLRWNSMLISKEIKND